MLGEIGESLIGLTYSPRDVREQGILVLRSSNIQGDALCFANNVFVDVPVPERIMVRAGDILICVRNGSRELIGKCALIDARCSGMTFGAFMAIFRTSHWNFVHHGFRSNLLKVQVREHLGATINQITNKSLNSFLLAIPPTLPEQHTIATALSDADGLIEALEDLIAKKRLIKQGAMQELLTGKRRLPGFSGEWGVFSLGNLFNISGGLSASRDQLGNTGICYLHYGDIHMSSHSYVDLQRDLGRLPKLDVPMSEVPSRSLLTDGDVVFVDASEDEVGTSKHVVVANPNGVPFIAGLHTIVAKAKTGMLLPAYLRHCFQATAVKRQFRFFAVGTKVLGVSKTNIAKVEVLVPPLPEQTAIATILSDMDVEIDALTAKLAKARDVKQGMMQELLTGRIRLI